jgi:ABC transporter substrate binding protein
MLRRAASYVDRTLRGANPAELPVQAPVKFDVTLNLKTAKTLGLTIPPNLLAIADEVIEQSGGSSLRGLAARRLGLSRRGRSRASGCGASVR